MPAVEINLTTEQLAVAYEQLSQHERRSFLLSVLTQPASEQITIEVLAELQAKLRRQTKANQKQVWPKL